MIINPRDGTVQAKLSTVKTVCMIVGACISFMVCVFLTFRLLDLSFKFLIQNHYSYWIAALATSGIAVVELASVCASVRFLVKKFLKF